MTGKCSKLSSFCIDVNLSEIKDIFTIEYLCTHILRVWTIWKFAKLDNLRLLMGKYWKTASLYLKIGNFSPSMERVDLDFNEDFNGHSWIKMFKVTKIRTHIHFKSILINPKFQMKIISFNNYFIYNLNTIFHIIFIKTWFKNWK